MFYQLISLPYYKCDTSRRDGAFIQYLTGPETALQEEFQTIFCNFGFGIADRLNAGLPQLRRPKAGNQWNLIENA